MNRTNYAFAYMVAGIVAGRLWADFGPTASILAIAFALIVISAVDTYLTHRRRRPPQSFGEFLEELNNNLSEVMILLGEQIEPPLRKVINDAQQWLIDVDRLIQTNRDDRER